MTETNHTRLGGELASIGFTNSENKPHLYTKSKDGKTYGVDENKPEAFYLDDLTRITDDPEDVYLQTLWKAVNKYGRNQKKPEEKHEVEKRTEEETEITPAETMESEQYPRQKVSTIEPVQQGMGTVMHPVSTPLLDLISKYTGNDVIEVFGDTGSGKSRFAMTVAREAIATGKKVFYLDTERNLTDADIRDIWGCEYKYTPVIEEIEKIVQNLPKADVVVIDSIGFPVLTTFARMSVKQKGDALLKLIAIFGDLKNWAYRHNGVVVVTNQPESEFNKGQGHVLRPFGDKSQFAAKEIWKTEIAGRTPDTTNINISAFRSRSVGHRTSIARMKITGQGVEVN